LIVGSLRPRSLSGPTIGFDILINSGELFRSLGGDASPKGQMGQISFCCDAMQEEIRPGDTVLLERDSGPGMTVRYLLPRIDGIQISIPFPETGERGKTMSDDQELQILRAALAGMPVTIESELSDTKASATSKLRWVKLALRVFRLPVGQLQTWISRTRGKTRAP
jgi:hypothetical protein